MVFLPVGVMQGLAAPLAGIYSDRHNAKVPLILGLLVMALRWAIERFKLPRICRAIGVAHLGEGDQLRSTLGGLVDQILTRDQRVGDDVGRRRVDTRMRASSPRAVTAPDRSGSQVTAAIFLRAAISPPPSAGGQGGQQRLDVAHGIGQSLVHLRPVPLQGRDVVGLAQDALRQIRGAQIAMIFQDPMTALNPYLKIGPQIVEPLRIHERVSGRTAAAKAIEAFTAGTLIYLILCLGISMIMNRVERKFAIPGLIARTARAEH
jgi:hypothetical protein